MRTASAMLRPKPLALPVHQNPPFSLFERPLVNHRLAFRLADITLEPLTHLPGELLISDEAAKVVGKLIVEYRLETRRWRDIQARRPSAGSALLFLRHDPGDVELRRVPVWGVLDDRRRLRPDRQGIKVRKSGVGWLGAP